MPRMLVAISCPDCLAVSYVWVTGPWDIADVKHECDPAGGSLTGTETFTVKFDPSRGE